MKLIPVNTLVRITLKEEIKPLYFPQPPGGVYYGIVFDHDDEHLILKGFAIGKNNRIVFGVINRFMNDDIRIERITIADKGE